MGDSSKMRILKKANARKTSVSGKTPRGADIGMCLAVPAPGNSKLKCRNKPVRGASLCAVHGGIEQLKKLKAAFGNPTAAALEAAQAKVRVIDAEHEKELREDFAKHGIYRRFLLPDEVIAYDHAKVGTLDEEIKAVKANLSRLLMLRLDNPKGGTGHGPSFQSFDSLIQTQHNLVRQYEQTRMQYALTGDGLNSSVGFTINVKSTQGVTINSVVASSDEEDDTVV